MREMGFETKAINYFLGDDVDRHVAENDWDIPDNYFDLTYLNRTFKGEGNLYYTDP